MELTELEKKFLEGCGYDETEYIVDDDVDYSDERMNGARVSLQNKGIIWVAEPNNGFPLYDIRADYVDYLGFDYR